MCSHSFFELDSQAVIIETVKMVRKAMFADYAFFVTVKPAFSSATHDVSVLQSGPLCLIQVEEDDVAGIVLRLYEAYGSHCSVNVTVSPLLQVQYYQRYLTKSFLFSVYSVLIHVLCPLCKGEPS